MSAYSRDKDLFACMALVKAKGIGPRTRQKIFAQYGSPAQALENFMNWKEDGLVRNDQFKTFASRSWEQETDQAIEFIIRRKLRVIIWSDPEYPETLRHINSPPAIMYFKGDTSLLKNHSLAVVGSRKSSRYGLDMARQICLDISAGGMTIVSGFAYGIDRQAHMSAVDNPGGTIAVLGTGIDLIYPAMNKDLWVKIVDKGLILTEFFPGTKPDPGNFPFRNRIISGLSLGVLVVQSAIKSGSMITAKLALDQNKEVFAVPGAVNMDNYDGCNQLIRQGAHLVQRANDILEVLAPMIKVSALNQDNRGPRQKNLTKPIAPENLNQDEQEVADRLACQEQTHIDDLTDKLGWSSQKVSQMLVLLEIKGLVRRFPGMYYSLTSRY